jgi:penicillin G amidase
MKKVLGRTVLAIVILLAIVCGAAFAWLFTSLPMKDGIVRLETLALSGKVEIIRDSRGVPHIRANRAADAYFALGYAHAQDRLWQMEGMRRLGAGRLSEVVGKRALRTDRFMRALGFYRLAERQFQTLNTDTRAVLESYSAGVNGFLETRSGSLPPEFQLLLTEPEPWKPADSLVWAKIMAMRLSGNWRDELLRARMKAHLSDEQIRQLWPVSRALPEGPPENAIKISAVTLDKLSAVLPAIAEPPLGASNGWAVSGERSTTGKPILANDPHLSFSAPILWFLARLTAPGFSLTGATVPGVPFFLVGHNRHIAWGMTSTESDLQDLFVERIDPQDDSRYLTPDGSKAFVTRQETIRVRGDSDHILSVRETRHGPVISDLISESDRVGGEGTVLALAATFLRGQDRTPQAMHRINRARDRDEFQAAMADFHAPQQNIVYADTAGNIGFFSPGRVPVRRSGRGRLPAPGWTGEADWTGMVHLHDLPRGFNPPDGRIIVANQKIVSDDYPHFITDDWAPGFRARRIGEILDGGSPQSLQSTAYIQRDSVSLMARQLLPLMTDIEAPGETENRVLTLMKTWDGVMLRRRPEPAIFAVWIRELNRAIYADELGGLFQTYWSSRPRFVVSALTRHTEWCDNIKTLVLETCDDLIASSLQRTITTLSDEFGPGFVRWRWADLHKARFDHSLFGGIPVLERLTGLRIATDGGNFTINRGTTHINNADDPFGHIHGSGLRALFDLSDPTHSRFMIATGQSGNPLSSHYGDLLMEWRDGRYMRLDLSDGELKRTAVGTLTLVP